MRGWWIVAIAAGALAISALLFVIFDDRLGGDEPTQPPPVREPVAPGQPADP